MARVLCRLLERAVAELPLLPPLARQLFAAEALPALWGLPAPPELLPEPKRWLSEAGEEAVPPLEVVQWLLGLQLRRPLLGQEV